MANNTISILIQAKDEASKVLKGVSTEVENSSGRMSSSLKGASAVGGAALAGLAAAAAAASAAVVAGSIASINAYADYQQSLNIFRSVSSVTNDQMVIVANTAKQLGKDITLPGVSAKDAALAMVELSKAGLTVNDTLGAAKGVLSLAKAGQLDVAAAATIAASALNAFGMKGDEASRVADILAGGANASSAGVQDLALALQQASASASRFKVPLNDTVTALGLFANNGIAGSDAGTSLKTMFANLIPTTDKQSKMMNKLGLDFFNAKGQFVGLRATAEQLQKKLAGLTDEQRQLAIETIFGSDASRAAGILAKEGGEGFDKLAAGVNKANAATSLAAAQNSGLKGSFENIKSVVETLAIDFGEKLAPSVQIVADFMGQNLEQAARQAYAALTPMLETLRVASLQAWQAIQQHLGPSLQALWSTIQNQLVPSLRQFTPYLDDIAKILGGTIVAALWVVINMLNLAVKWVAFLGNAWIAAKDLVIGAIDQIGAYLVYLKDNWAVIVGQIIGYFLTLPFKIPLLIYQAVMAIDWGFVGSLFVKGWQWQIDAVKNLFMGLLNWISHVNWGDAIKFVITSNINTLMGLLEGAVRGALKGLPGGLEKSFKLPRFASGTNYAPGGVALVGERGPELVNLPRGSQVYTASQTAQMAAGSQTTNVLSGTFTFNDKSAVEEFFDRLDQTQRLARMGMA